MSTDDTTNFWKVETSDQAYWGLYMATRPNYSQDFYSLMYEYHASHSTSFAVAHDVGTGPGQVAAQLASRFDHVIASDNNSAHLDVARRRLSTFPPTHITFSLSTGEDLTSQHPPKCADFIAAAEMFPLMDATSALSSFASLLKPGGTLAIWFYGRPHFAERQYAIKCQRILDSIMDHSFAKAIKGGGPAKKAGWKRAADGMASWLDYIDFPLRDWENVRRMKWNPQMTMPFFGPDACDFDIEPVQNIGEKDEVSETEDLGFWKNEWDMAGVKEFVSASFPTSKDTKGMVDKVMDDYFKDLTEAMGGEHEVRAFSWPVVLILATRSSS